MRLGEKGGIDLGACTPRDGVTLLEELSVLLGIAFFKRKYYSKLWAESWPGDVLCQSRWKGRMRSGCLSSLSLAEAVRGVRREGKFILETSP